MERAGAQHLVLMMISAIGHAAAHMGAQGVEGDHVGVFADAATAGLSQLDQYVFRVFIRVCDVIGLPVLSRLSLPIFFLG